MTPLPVIVENIPVELRRDLPRWCVWRYNTEHKKIPYQSADPDQEAKVNDETHWGSFDAALRVYESGGFHGIGLLLGDGLSGVDIDDCIDPNTGEINAFARDIVTRLNSYTERSPSGTGIKVFIRASLGKNYSRPGLECYGGKRYFCVTGHRV